MTQCCAGARSRGGEVPPSRPKNTANCQNGIKREKKVNINSITSMEEHGCKSFSEIGRCPSKQITLRDGEFRLAPPPPKHPTQGTSSRSRSILASIPRLLPLSTQLHLHPPLLSTFYPLATTSSPVIFSTNLFLDLRKNCLV